MTCYYSKRDVDYEVLDHYSYSLVSSDQREVSLFRVKEICLQIFIFENIICKKKKKTERKKGRKII